MLTQRGELVGVRFFEAIEALREDYSIPEICERIGTDVSNFYRKRRGERGTAKLPVEWLSALVIHYGVSAEWLLIGKGNMFN